MSLPKPLIDLDAKLLKYTVREVDQTSFADTTAYPGKRKLEMIKHTDSLADADGIRFMCPKCGEHQVMVWFRGCVPDDVVPGPGRWQATGSSLADLSLYPSISLTHGCQWHGFVTAGAAK